MAEREVDAASTSIRDSISSVANMSGLGFLDSTGKSLTISDPDNRSCDVSYFTFRSSLNRNNVDHCALNTVNQFEFSSRLFDNLPSSSVNISLPSPSIVPNQSSVHIFNATLSGLTDDQLNKMLENEMRDTLSAQRASLFTSVPSNTSRSLNFFYPKILDHDSNSYFNSENGYFRSPSSVGSTYTKPLDFLDDQSSFNNIFGLAPKMLLITTLSLLMRSKSPTLFVQNSPLFVVTLNYSFSIISFNYYTLVLILTIPNR